MNATVEEWRGDFNTFLRQAQARDTPTWALSYEERRLASKEERVMKQMTLEGSWTCTPVHGVWRHVRAFASPHMDFHMTRDQFCTFLAAIGITSPTYHDRIWSLFSEPLVANRGGSLNALCFVKTIDLGLCEEATCKNVLRHCFNALPLRLSGNPADPHLEQILVVEDAARVLAQGKPTKSSLVSALALDSLATLTTHMNESGLDTLCFDEFCCMFLTSTTPNFGDLFIKQIVEACAKYFREPFGTLPHIPPRWLEDLAPIPFNPAVPADADALLLQDVERRGLGTGPKTQKTKKKKKKASSKYSTA